MDLVQIAALLALAVVGAFVTIVVRKAAQFMWVATTWVARGVFWVLIGWWVERIKRYAKYGF